MPVLLARIGRFSARHRIMVIAGWVLLFGALTAVLATGSSGTSSVSVPSTAAGRTLTTVQDKFPGLGSSDAAQNSLRLVMTAAGPGYISSPAQAAHVAGVLQQAARVAHVASVSNPLNPKTLLVSADQTTAVSTLTFTGLTDQNRKAVYDQVLHVAGGAGADVRVEVGGELIAQDTPAAGAGEIVGVLIALLVLFLTFGSLLVAGANLLVALAGVGVSTVGVLAYGSINPIQPTTITLATMLGLAVGIDYSLFILTRFRSELRQQRSVDDAIGRAIGTAGTAVVFAGLTVIIALAALSVVQISFITEMGLAGAAGVLVAVLMALTVLPVVMRSIGRRVLPRREHNAETTVLVAPVADEANRLVRGWGGFVVRRPLLAIVGAAAVLLVVAVPMLSMKTASSVPGGNDPASTERTAYNLVLDKFGGIQSPLLVLVTGTVAGQATGDVVRELSSLPGAQSVQPGAVTSAGDAALITVIPTGGPIDDVTKDLVREIRNHADTVPGVQLAVTGETAIGIDSDSAQRAALIKYVIVIVGLSFLLLMLMFRSLLVPLVATLGYLLSVGASFGASVAVFQWGWLGPLIPAPQGDPMLSILPIILVGVLFGLAMDYQVFLVSRIHELHGRGFGPKDAVRQGFSRSAPVLIAAATIMAVVFGGFATSPMAVAASIAFGLVIGVLADAFLVRMVITPALLVLLGDAAWWLPRWLDRLLPNLDLEGHALDEAEAPKELVLV